MTSIEDRRSPVAVRVSHTALVDICSQTGCGSPFQAESTNISGRGMRVRTSFLPEIGEDLVCRFNHGEQEVLVEGVVAWRAEGQDSGEFGIQFTALDADSAEVLTSLGETMTFPPRVPSAAAPDTEDEFLTAGARVRLHIDGLGAPMKACVHDGSSRKIRVGSSLEFLKLGRPLELESVSEGERRSAHIDSVNVVMNPSTRIPELVVQLRYEGVSPTPAPARADAGPLPDSRRAVAEDEADEDEVDTFGEDEPESWEPAAEALRARLVSVMSGAGAAARKAGGVLSSLASSTGATIRKESTAKRARTNTQWGRPPSTSQRRLQTHRLSQPAPTHLRSGIHDLGMASKREQPRASSPRRAAGHEAEPKRKLRAGLIFGVAFLLFAGSAVGLRGFTQTATSPAPSAQQETATDTVEQDVTTAAAEPDEAASQPASDPQGVVAEVPLFGPQAMAVKAAEQEPSAEALAEAEKRAAAASVDDQSWEESEPDLKNSDGKPWGRGRLYLPTVHRIRLDGAGTALAGAMNADGFTVVVPGRKAMESGKAIEKRDKRIVSVLTNNNSRGATIKFEFRGPVPPYRARLRQDFVEFLVSAPEDTVGRL